MVEKEPSENEKMQYYYMEKTKNGKNKKNNRLCRARGKLGSSWLLAITVSMVSLNLCSSFSSSVLIIIINFAEFINI